MSFLSINVYVAGLAAPSPANSRVFFACLLAVDDKGLNGFQREGMGGKDRILPRLGEEKMNKL